MSLSTPYQRNEAYSASAMFVLKQTSQRQQLSRKVGSQNIHLEFCKAGHIDKLCVPSTSPPTQPCIAR